MWHACIRTTSQSTLSLYLPIEKETNTCPFTLTSPQSFNHCNLYGLGCFKVGKFNFSTKVVLATLVQLPPSMIILHTLLLMWHLIWKIFSLCCSISSSLTWALKARLVTSDSPSTEYSTLSSQTSSSDGIWSSSHSLLVSTSPSIRAIMVLLFGHCEAIWPTAKQWKHLISWLCVLDSFLPLLTIGALSLLFGGSVLDLKTVPLSFLPFDLHEAEEPVFWKDQVPFLLSC